MEFIKLTLGFYQTNCYICWGADSTDCLVIDPGYEPEQVLHRVQQQGKTLSAILLTHGHFDHVGGVKILARKTGCRVYLCQADLALPGGLTDGTLYCTDFYGDGDTLTLAGLTVQVLHTPGHTPGSVCLRIENDLFSGDTLFQCTCGRTDLYGGNHAQMLRSLAELARIPGDCRVHPGHGRPTTLAQERSHNPYMGGDL